MKKWLIAFLLYFSAPAILAEEQGIGEMANQFVAGPLASLWGFMNGLCYIIGIIMLITSYEKYRRYRQNMMETTLSAPIMYFALGVLIILIPLTAHLVGINFQ